MHEDTFGRSDHVTFRDLGAQTIFHLGVYDEDYSAYHSLDDTLDNMVEVVGGQELENSLEFVMWVASCWSSSSPMPRLRSGTSTGETSPHDSSLRVTIKHHGPATATSTAAALIALLLLAMVPSCRARRRGGFRPDREPTRVHVR